MRIPKCRRNVVCGRIGQHLGKVIRKPVRQRESLVLEGYLCSDHNYEDIAIPPKYAVAQVVGYVKGKSVIRIARSFGKTHPELTVLLSCHQEKVAWLARNDKVELTKAESVLFVNDDPALVMAPKNFDSTFASNFR
ncbi:transposase [Pelovirga terrestris]|uniref:Transposase n=1 Tax=Pelovirga terrestris TaxID=2771352 RepID=A0A8J6QZ70_9BACT|nr:transposase [Pelovirga terrestris]MBD1401898.1 transposase [Pelovirga terrestris]